MELQSFYIGVKSSWYQFKIYVITLEMFYVMLMITTKVSLEYTQQEMRGNKSVSLQKKSIKHKEGQ